MGSELFYTKSGVDQLLLPYASLPTDVASLQTQLDEAVKGPLLGIVDLDTIIEPGVYQQHSSTAASSGSNYPTGLAGMLEVFSNGWAHTGNMIWQRYTPYGINAKVIYMRAFYNGTWYDWKKFDARPNNQPQQIVAAGEVSISLNSEASDFVQADISAFGFSQPPSFAGVSHNYSYYVYKAGSGSYTNLTLPVGVRHFDNVSGTTTVTVYWVAIGV